MNRKSVLRNDAHNSIEQMCKQIYTCTYSHSDIRITRTLKDEDGRQELTESGHTEIKLERRNIQACGYGMKMDRKKTNITIRYKRCEAVVSHDHSDSEGTRYSKRIFLQFVCIRCCSNLWRVVQEAYTLNKIRRNFKLHQFQ